jgi:glycosyltransferase involved in cell wall biosynthesis
LGEIKKTVFNTDKFDINWHIIFDTNVIQDIPVEIILLLSGDKINVSYIKSEEGDHGHQLINETIDSIKSGWIYVLDDDNVIHENFYTRISEVIKTNKKFSGFIFQQKIGGIDFTGLDIRECGENLVKVGKIDMAQFLLKRELINEVRIPKGYYVGDGMFIEEIFNRNKNKFIFIDEILCYYNYFQQNKKPNKRTLPRILLLGMEDQKKLESKFYAKFESVELFTEQDLTDEKLDSKLKSFDPDCIVTVGESFNIFENLNHKSYDIRKRWIHFDNFKEEIGEAAFNCATNYIMDQHYRNNPLISFFTPIYNTGDKLWRTYESVKNQTYSNWEWVLVNDSNDGGKTLKIAEKIAETDGRVRVYDFHKKTQGIVGESKYRAACLCNGVYLMELDHDDYITPDAGQLMVEAFQKYPDCKFVYSDFAEIDENHNSLTYGDYFSFGYGAYRDESFNGRNYKTVNTPNINPKTIRHIVGVPNHFRAWDRFFYHSIGGHNRRLSIADDYELLVRTFLMTKMVRIPKLLYLQFYHDSNTQNATRKDIQRRVRMISTYYNEQIKMRFDQLGIKDWAYDFNAQNPLSCESKFGLEENAVNYVMRMNSEYEYNWSNLRK